MDLNLEEGGAPYLPAEYEQSNEQSMPMGVITFRIVSSIKSCKGGVRRMKTRPSIFIHRAGSTVWRGYLTKPGNGVTLVLMRLKIKINP